MTDDKYTPAEQRILARVVALLIVSGALAVAGLVWLIVAVVAGADASVPVYLILAAVVVCASGLWLGTWNHSRARKRWEAQ